MNGSTRLSFMSAHLEAHEGHSKFKARCSSLGEILGGTKNSRWLDVSQTSHFTFTFGDLNFRTVLDPSLPKDAHRRAIQGMVDRENWYGLNKSDELHMALAQKKCLVGYKTPMCNFPPTFKTVVKRGFEWQEKRRPSYCDRVLWKAGPDLDKSICPIVYEPIPDYSTSDHKPVRAAFTIELNRPFRIRPVRGRVGAAANRIKKSFRIGDHRATAASENEAENERVEFFLSNISVDLYNKEGIPPNPYVAVVSYPEEALLMTTSKWRFRPRLRRRVERGKRRINGWPSTSRKFSTFSPSWVGEEEIKYKISLHHPDGSPVDLTGAMLHLVVADYNPAMEDSVIGSVRLNLPSILSKCQARAGIQQSQNEFTASSPRSRFRAAGKSIMAVLSRHRKPEESEIHPTLLPASSLEDPITSTSIDEILIKNGKEVGRITLTMETWWVNSVTADILGRKPIQSSKPRTSILGDITRRRKSNVVRRSSLVPVRN